MSENTKKALIALIAFIGGLLSGLVGAPYAGLVEAGTKAATEVVEAVPTKEEAPAAPAPEAKAEVPADPAAPVAPAEPVAAPATEPVAK
jgi:hypothetical protein